MTYKIIHTLSFDRQFAQYKHLREKIIAIEDQLREDPYQGRPYKKDVGAISLEDYIIFYRINKEAIILLEIRLNTLKETNEFISAPSRTQ